jgi:hypothetical protein
LSVHRRQKPHNTIDFYPIVINKINVTFSNDELTLLNKGLKYSLNHKRKHLLSNLAFEAETAISLLPTWEQDYISYHVTHSIQRLYKQQNDRQTGNNMQENNENKTIIQIKEKLIKNKAMTSKADKGNSIVILYQDDYNKKSQRLCIQQQFYCGQ